MSTTVSYKGNTIATLSNETKTLTTAGSWVEGNITVTDVMSGVKPKVTITSTGHSSSCYVQYNGTKYYTAEDNFEFNEGDTLYCHAAHSEGGSIYINDEPVAISSTTGVNYTLTLGKYDVNVQLSYSRSPVIRISLPVIPSGTYSVSSGGTFSIANYSEVSVASGTAGTPTAAKGTVSNHSISVTPSVANTTGYITGGTKTGTAVTVTASELASGNKEITQNGTNIDVVGYSTVSVAVPSSSTAIITDTTDAAGGTVRTITTTDEVHLQTKTITPTSSQQTVLPDTGYNGFSSVIVEKCGREDLCEPKAVNFMDYDGRLLYSYTVNEFMALTALPPNPTNEGLTAQGWNWSLEDAKEQVAVSDGLLIGQMYIPNDGNTHINISIPYSGRKVMLLRFGQTVTNGVIVNWGDGNVDTISETGVANHTHTYEKGGMYEITIEVSNGQIKWNSSNNYFITGQLSSSENNSCRTYISSVYLGGGFTTFGSAENITGLQTVKIVTVPKWVTSISIRGIAQNPSLQALVIPNTVTSIGEYTFQQNYAMKRISFPDSLVAYPTGTLKQTYSIENFYIHKDCTAIPNGMLYRANALAQIVIPEDVTSIGTEAFYQCYALQELHLLPTTPPTLSNTNAFTGIPSDCIFYVPYSADHSVLEAYQTATNWSTYASRIQEESQS